MKNFITVPVDIYTNSKMLRLRAKINERDAVHYVLRIWSHAGKFYPKTGSFKDATSRELEAIAGWIGEPGRLIGSMIELGLLQITEGEITIPGWAKSQPHLITEDRLIKRRKTRESISPRIRWIIFQRDDFKCQYCGASLSLPGVRLVIDHKTPVSKGGTNDKSNLITACESCNAGKGNL